MINAIVSLHVLQVTEDGEVSVQTLSSATGTVKQSEENESQEERKDRGHFPRLTFHPHERCSPLIDFPLTLVTHFL